jgi:hypothetical protein
MTGPQPGRLTVKDCLRTYTKGNLDIYLLEVAHPEKAPLELTNEPSTDFSPRWMPGETGRQIALFPTVLVRMKSGSPVLIISMTFYQHQP